MEPRKDETKKDPPPSKEQKRRFRIVKLEERVAPRIGGRGRTYHGPHCAPVSR